jgi:hypothetical protein
MSLRVPKRVNFIGCIFQTYAPETVAASKHRSHIGIFFQIPLISGSSLLIAISKMDTFLTVTRPQNINLE